MGSADDFFLSGSTKNKIVRRPDEPQPVQLQLDGHGIRMTLIETEMLKMRHLVTPPEIRKLVIAEMGDEATFLYALIEEAQRALQFAIAKLTELTGLPESEVRAEVNWKVGGR